MYLLAWIPESLLNEKGQSEWDKFVRIEEHAVTNDEDEGRCSLTPFTAPLHLFTDAVLIDLPMQRPESYAFSVPITSIYSLIVSPPSLSSWCTCLPVPAPGAYTLLNEPSFGHNRRLYCDQPH